MSVKVSVVVPVYKVEEYLPRCLDSLLAQSLTDIEIICVNDGSPDGCQGILESYAARDGRVRILVQENGGLSAARNTGLSAVSAPYVMFCDSDDWVEETWCEELLAAIEAGGADFAVSRAAIDGECAEKKRRELTRNQRLRFSGVCDVVPEMVARIDHAVWTKIFRMSVIRRYGIDFPVGKLCEDWPFSQRYLAASRKVAFVDRELYHYFQRAGSILNGGEKAVRSDCDYLGHWELLRKTLVEGGKWDAWRSVLMRHYVQQVAGVAYFCADRERLYLTTDRFVSVLSPQDFQALPADVVRGLRLVEEHVAHLLRTFRTKLGPLTVFKVKRTMASTTYYLLGLPVFRRRWT